MESTKNSVDFFLGAVGAHGFNGFFSQLEEEGLQLCLLKSGPGCGKSTLMRRLADQAGQPVQRIHCSSDPDSLDGVIFPQQGAAVLDATPPHAIEPAHPMLTEQVISLYDSIDPIRLAENRREILAQSAACKELHARAARYIALAASLLADSRQLSARFHDLEKARRYANRLAGRLFPVKNAAGRESLRYLSALTPAGEVVFSHTVPALARDIYVLHDEAGACSHTILSTLRTAALARGCSVITCPCPMNPDKLEHLFLPETGLAFLTANSWHSFAFGGQKNIHCTRFALSGERKKPLNRLRFQRCTARRLLSQAQQLQKQAKVCHDQLEAAYRPAVDYTVVDRAAARLEQILDL